MCLVDVLSFFLFLSCFVLNTHYMWFIEGQDLATEAVESSLLSDWKAIKCIGWCITETKNS